MNKKIFLMMAWAAMIIPKVWGCSGDCGHISGELKYFNAFRPIVYKKKSDSALNAVDYNTVKLIRDHNKNYLSWPLWNRAWKWDIQKFGKDPDSALKIAEEQFANVLVGFEKAEQNRKDDPNKYNKSDSYIIKKLIHNKLDSDIIKKLIQQFENPRYEFDKKPSIIIKKQIKKKKNTVIKKWIAKKNLKSTG